MSEPLLIQRQYLKNIGRNLKVIKKNNDVCQGKLEKANDKNIELLWKVREPKPIGKGKITVQKEAVIDYKDIVEATVMIKFN